VSMARSSAPAPASPAPTPLPREDDVPISALISYRLSRISNSLSRSAGLAYRRSVDVSLGEWRTLSLLGENGSLTLNRLARRAALDKAQMSRVVKGLVDRGLVERTQGVGRSTVLTLSAEGEEAYLQLITIANERDRRIRRHLGVREQEQFIRALETLTALTRVIEEEELAHQAEES
jgi:DNA-binding MarR family transcriptional regulator